MKSSTAWVEKYRPKSIDDVVHQHEVISALKSSLETHNLPHLLFYGTILAVCHQLFGPEYFSTRVLELNASDERGIDVIRTKVKSFAQISVGGKPKDYKYPLPPFKVIILDEADNMTKDAQAALRRTIEKYSNVTRFCLICNYVSRIIEPLTSRCAKFRFKALDETLLTERLELICEKEGIKASKESLHDMMSISSGDMRRAITLLQSAKMMFGKEIESKDILKISGIIPDSLLKDYYKSCSSKSYEKLTKSVKILLKEGYSAKQFIKQLIDDLIHSKSFSDLQKSRIILQIAEIEKNLLDGSDEYLQLMSLGGFIIRNME